MRTVGNLDIMEFIWIAFLAVVVAALVIGWQRSKKSAAGTAPAGPGLEDGVLTLSGVSPRPVEADQKGQAFVTVSGSIAGPSTAPTAVYRQLVVDFAQRWPEVGDQWPVYYKVGKVDSSWQLGSLTPPPDSYGPPEQYPG
ncbi:Secreted protein OS=Tsukamurella paurometabola (strain ATCC 8368 / DSM / CCUG 35730 / CIP 100753/ JCM 10117 / KCTC 9821 / NBRC 16120 / NCIMB 702349 / NCTC 13040) OX=521096 GN=Tpau_3026 PE=4 SV=1 [Tsukamurella paurometabola]|nr:Uncharacterised protein [Tsukamurella paurometabola]